MLSVHESMALQVLKEALAQRSLALQVARFLVLTLRPDDVFVLDNLLLHKISDMRK